VFGYIMFGTLLPRIASSSASLVSTLVSVTTAVIAAVEPINDRIGRRRTCITWIKSTPSRSGPSTNGADGWYDTAASCHRRRDPAAGPRRRPDRGVRDLVNDVERELQKIPAVEDDALIDYPDDQGGERRAACRRRCCGLRDDRRMHASLPCRFAPIFVLPSDI
jgi:hypothetical protein